MSPVSSVYGILDMIRTNGGNKKHKCAAKITTLSRYYLGNLYVGLGHVENEKKNMLDIIPNEAPQIVYIPYHATHNCCMICL